MLKSLILMIIFSLGLGAGLSAAAEKPVVGRKAADKYFKKRKKNRFRRKPSSAGKPRYMALQLGSFLSEDTYKWGEKGENEVGNLIGGVTYRMGEWTNSMDLLFRADVVSFSVDDTNPVKLSLMPMITFPDARSSFPIYFGGGLGLGIFFKQAPGESSLSFDYQLMAGARFFEVFRDIGLIFETGVKNHVFLLSDGQHNSVYFSAGTIFRF